MIFARLGDKKQTRRQNMAEIVFSWVGRLLRPDIVHFRSACGGTEILLRELALLNTLSSNPKSSRSYFKFYYIILFSPNSRLTFSLFNDTDGHVIFVQ